MSFFMKLAAYVFLALMGLSAWRAGVEGWRYYFGIVLFIVCTLRILMILKQRMNKKAVPKDSNAQPAQNQVKTNDTAGPTPPVQ
jgi:membrane protein implicated in regulation of membrane protease activity